MKNRTYSASIFNSPVGELKLIMEDSDLVGITWPDDKRRFPWDADTLPDSPYSKKMAETMQTYFQTRKMKVHVWSKLTGTPLQVQVWQALMDIPFGQTVTYSDVAKAVRRPQAVRAVASAIGKNPISILIPCHRVLGKNKNLTGFAGGLEAKKWLLNWEKENI